ncbi:g9324 [Coccomyxa elongata]
MDEEERLKTRLHKMSDYQSYDFSFKDTDLEKEVRKRQKKAKAAGVQRWRWLLVVTIGATVAVLSMLVNLGISGLNVAKIRATESLIYSRGGFWGPYFTYVGMSAAYALCAGAVVAFWAPAAAGSGMSEIKAYFNGVHTPGLLTLRTLIGKLVSATFVLAAGLIAEGEAPFVHIGAIVGGGIASTGSRSLTKLLRGKREVKLPRSWGGFFRNDYDHRDFTAVGAAAGMSVAFAAPVSGMVFIAEESAANLGAPVHYRALVGNCVAILVFNILSAGYNSGANFWNVRLFAQLDTSTADVLGLFYVRLWEVPIFMAMACVIGALGAVFVTANTRIVYALRQRCIPHSSRYRRTLEVAALAVLTGTLWFGVSYGSPCRPVPSQEIQAVLSPELLPSNIVTFAQYNNYPRLWCSAGQYSVYGRVFLRPPRLMLKNLVGLSQGSVKGLERSFVDAPTAALYGGLTFAMLTITYGAGASLGVITPVLQFGAACGVLVGHGVAALATLIDSSAVVSVPTYAVVGAAAFLSGCIRYKASAVLITFESIGAWFLVVPITIAVFFAKVVADRFGRGLFEEYLHLACVPFVPEPMTSSTVGSVSNQLSVADVMATGVTALRPVILITDLIHILQSSCYQAFPVTEEVEQAAQPGAEFHVLGVIERKALLKMLQHRIGFCGSAEAADDYGADGSSGSLPQSREELLALLVSFEQRPFKINSPEDQAAILRDVEQSCVGRWLNLRPFMFRAPLLMQQGASLTRALSLFRQMGLHHILVAPPDPRAIGFITRKDLVFDNACLAHLRKRRAEEGAAAASNGVDADPERGQQHTVTGEADNHIGMAYREEQCSSGIDGINVLTVGNGRGETYVHEWRQ